jgi:secreted Zn-dependent insulinase-like peptidase
VHQFPWGNTNSLRTEPEAEGIDVMQELREFYRAHYYARNMRLVVLAGYELDEVSVGVLARETGKWPGFASTWQYL